MRKAGGSRTAQYVALVRTVLHEDGEVDDPYARPMLDRSMRIVAAALSRSPLRTWRTSAFFAALAARTLFFDQEVRSAGDAGIDQVVTVGAGYDARPWRFARPGVRFFEVDHPATQADKRRLAPAGGPTYVPADLEHQTIADALAGSGFDPARAVLYVIEGVTMYLTRAVVEELLHHLASTSAPGSRLAVNFAAPPGTGGPVDRQRQRLVRLVGRAGGEGHHFFATPPEAGPLVAGAGWSEVRARALRDVAAELLDDTRLNVAGINDAAAVVAASLPA